MSSIHRTQHVLLRPVPLKRSETTLPSSRNDSSLSVVTYDLASSVQFKMVYMRPGKPIMLSTPSLKTVSPVLTLKQFQYWSG